MAATITHLGEYRAIHHPNGRSSQHAFAAIKVIRNKQGVATQILLRNPYATQGPNKDGYITSSADLCFGRTGGFNVISA